MANSIMTELVTINAPGKDVKFDGVDFTKNAMVVIKTAKSVTFVNCRFYKIVPNAPKCYLIKSLEESEACKIVIKNCYFGDNPTVDNNKMYNLIELHGKVSNGTIINENYFSADCCTHNQINLYEAEKSEKLINIEINKNYAEKSDNLIRLGFRGIAKCNVDIIQNRYDYTTAGEFAGLLLIQPCGNQTTSFNDMSVRIAKTINRSSDKQLIYMYSGDNDTHFSKSKNYPKVYIDTKKIIDVPYAGSNPIDD